MAAPFDTVGSAPDVMSLVKQVCSKGENRSGWSRKMSVGMSS